MHDDARPGPSLDDLTQATEVYSHDHAGPGGADRLAIYRHASGDYLERAWGVDPDHGDYDRLRWIPAEQGPARVEQARAADLRRYPETAPLTRSDLPGGIGFGLLILALVAGVVVFVARAVLAANEALPR